jgi:FAD/FMN-containing dehydrogenase/Fe-S oxidoreductase
MLKNIDELRKEIDGEVLIDDVSKTIYATDASVYREMPLAVAIPKHTADIKKLICFASENKIPLVPRTAGTSIAGQVVGIGIIVDVSKHLNRIIEVNASEKWVRVEPGVVLDELNIYLQPYGLFFGPETSTSNRCMIGGMLGNNSCGAHSIVYGSVREHTLAVKTILSDGSEVEFVEMSVGKFQQKCELKTLEGSVYNNIYQILKNDKNREEISCKFPDPDLKRRNTGYAIDVLLQTEPFTAKGNPINLSKLIAGSEGTLAFVTEIKLNLVDLPPANNALICVHCNSLGEAFDANMIALEHKPVAIELMDNIILDCTKNNIEQRKNRFFLEGDPAALLLVELAYADKNFLDKEVNNIITQLKSKSLGYTYPVLYGNEIKKVWALRKAGLGLLSNIPGDAKPVAVTEDTAVSPKYLSDYIAEYKAMLEVHGLHSVYYGHAATGELHLRPVLNLKDEQHVRLFRIVALETARIVKKYKGSLSGEHGDGRLRGEFIPLMVGEHNYQLFREIKKTWDPEGIFNPGKITDTPAMDSSMRFNLSNKPREFKTYFDFSNDLGLLRAIEKCNGSADCRKSEIIGGIMCPSYMAIKDESATTRARANLLREILTHSPKENPFDSAELYEILDLCISCKGCKSECPSSVDMAKLKAEFLQHYYETNRVPFRTWMIANLTQFYKLGALAPKFSNYLLHANFSSTLIKKMIGFAPQRPFPEISDTPLMKWYSKIYRQLKKPDQAQKIYFFCDEFINYNEPHIGIKAILLLHHLGYEVIIPEHLESGRTYLSKGLLKKAQKIARRNVELLSGLVSNSVPLIGIEPSAILSFRDEYPELVGDELKAKALSLATNVYVLDEFLVNQKNKGFIASHRFKEAKIKIKYHGHCQQKSIASSAVTKEMLQLINGAEVEELKTGCCGMAGAFGYEKEHYPISMKIGELALFPQVRKANECIVAANGTSCRHHIKDGTGTQTCHPVEILYDNIIK